jgi:type I restriction enzyme S subunit
MKKQLPKNWVDTELENLFNLIYGKGLSVNELTEDGYDVYGANGIIGKFTDYLYEKSKVVISCRGAASGAIHKTNPKSFITSNSIVLNEISSDLINLNFIKYVMTDADKSDVITGTAQPQITIQLLKNLKIPLPPLPEQNRIVEKLDTLFAQLETIKASLANIPLLLKDFRQQVLTQAVTGKLTEHLNKTPVSLASTITIGKLFEDVPDNWKWVKLIDIAKLESGHTPRKSEELYWIEGNIPWISLQDIRAAHGKIISETKYMPNELGIRKSSARLLPKGTVCFCRDISVGYTTVMGREMSTTQHFANWVCGDSLNNMFLLYAFMSAKDFLIASGKGTTVGTIYMPALKELMILLPPIKEQQEIVSRVESLFAKAYTIEQQYQALKEKIDTLPQALLHKAFKGELTEQLESDGNARELLQQIQELKGTTSKVAKNTKLEKLKSFNKKIKNYSQSEGVLGMVAEPK